MSVFLFANNAQSTLAGSISNTALVLNVQAGGGALFPSPSAGQQFGVTLTDAATGLIREITYCTLRTGDTFTVIRAQEGTTALNWSANDLVANLWTAGQAAAMLQQGQSQAQSSNYAVDVGAANAYVANYNPTVATPVAGMPLRVKIANTNTGPSTFNPGSGAAAIVSGVGAALRGGELTTGLIAEFQWTGTAYELIAPGIGSVQAQAQTGNYAADTGGSANVYSCTLIPALAANVVGAPIRIKVAHTNTGASTFNPGPGIQAIKRRDGSALIGNELIIGDIVTLKWDGTNYRIDGVAPATAAAAAAKTDTQSAITPGNIGNAFPQNFAGTDGYIDLPGGLTIQYGQIVAVSGVGTPVTFPKTFGGGGLRAVTIVANFVTTGAAIIAQDYVDGGNVSGFTLHNETGSSGNYNWIAIGGT